VGRYARLDGELGVSAQVPPLAVYRQEVGRLDHVEQVEQLAGRRVAGHVDLGDVLVYDVRAGPGEPVDHAVHGRLVAGYQRRGEHHGVTGPDVDVPVVAVGHAAEGTHRLALGAGRHQDDLRRRQAHRLVDADHESGRDAQQAEVA